MMMRGMGVTPERTFDICGSGALPKNRLGPGPEKQPFSTSGGRIQRPPVASPGTDGCGQVEETTLPPSEVS
jgi:hypothetical protein